MIIIDAQIYFLRQVEYFDISQSFDEHPIES